MDENKKKDRAPLIVASVLLIALLACMIILIVSLAKRIEENKQEAKRQELLSQNITMTPEATLTPTPKPEENFSVKEVENEVFRYLGEVYIIRNKGGYGLSDLDGKVLVQPVYNKWVYHDKEWICFENGEGVSFVYNYQGELLYNYTCNTGWMTTERGQNFYRAVFYRQGMRIEFDYNDEENYYGIHYYNAETGNLIFELTDEMQLSEENPWPDLLVTSLPDQNGTAVVIAGNGINNTMYLINKNGYTVEEYQEEYVERRYFYYCKQEVWNRTNLYDGWLLTTIMEERGELLDYSEEWADSLYNIYTRERVPLPEEYQDMYGEFYQHSIGLYYGMAGESSYAYEDNQTDYLYYAICHGSKKLTEEIYQWINFGETYIIAGNRSFSHILDYEGNVLAEYEDVAFPFVDGKTLVCDETGCFFIDENLQKCSGYIMKDVDYCYPNFIRKGNEFYLVRWKVTEE